MPHGELAFADHAPQEAARALFRADARRKRDFPRARGAERFRGFREKPEHFSGHEIVADENRRARIAARAQQRGVPGVARQFLPTARGQKRLAVPAQNFRRERFVFRQKARRAFELFAPAAEAQRGFRGREQPADFGAAKNEVMHDAVRAAEGIRSRVARAREDVERLAPAGIDAEKKNRRPRSLRRLVGAHFLQLGDRARAKRGVARDRAEPGSAPVQPGERGSENELAHRRLAPRERAARSRKAERRSRGGAVSSAGRTRRESRARRRPPAPERCRRKF